MKLLKLLPLLLVSLLFAGLSESCTKDDDDNEVDLTSKITGTYLGTYDEGSVFTVEDVETTITKSSEDRINIKIDVIPGLATFNLAGEMTDETNFTIPKTDFGDDEIEGTGKLERDTNLTLSLTNVSTKIRAIGFTGEKQ